jgi:molybdate transport system regulatory protein
VLLTQAWFISGARRGVGKTYLAKHLCAVLPSSIYIKYGHGKIKRGKSEHFVKTEKELKAFVNRCWDSYEHIVIEANVFEAIKQGSIKIFVAARAKATDLRRDAETLQEKADICVCSGKSRADWRKVLAEHLSESRLIETVLDIFSEQQRRLSREMLSVRSKVWLVNAEEQHIFGAGLAQLLVEVEHLGSLREAAKKANVSYQRAQKSIDKAEEQLGHKLIIQQEKDSGEKLCLLTHTGKQMLAAYLSINEKAASFVDETFTRTFEKELSVLFPIEKSEEQL